MSEEGIESRVGRLEEAMRLVEKIIESQGESQSLLMDYMKQVDSDIRDERRIRYDKELAGLWNQRQECIDLLMKLAKQSPTEGEAASA